LFFFLTGFRLGFGLWALGFGLWALGFGLDVVVALKDEKSSGKSAEANA
jgi:hypothetical protein